MQQHEPEYVEYEAIHTPQSHLVIYVISKYHFWHPSWQWGMGVPERALILKECFLKVEDTVYCESPHVLLTLQQE